MKILEKAKTLENRRGNSACTFARARIGGRGENGKVKIRWAGLFDQTTPSKRLANRC